MSVESDRPEAADERLAMLAALVGGDVPLAYRLATELLAQGVPFEQIVVDVLGPVQTELGRRWAAGDLGIADEHAASAAIENLLVRLGATAETPQGPAVVVASAEHDAHALGGRVVASALALEGYRVMFLGASVPAAHLADFLEMQQPFALALSCSMPTALVGVARSVDAAHGLAIPVVGGGRALTTQRATRLGLDAHAHVPADAVEILRSWSSSPPSDLAPAPDPIPEHDALLLRTHALVAAALESTTSGDNHAAALAEELRRVVQIVESALLVEESELIDEHLRWLLDTGPAHGYERGQVRAALVALAGAMDGDLQRAGSALRAVID